MRVLILNWRDIKNPSAGGAEVLIHEVAKRWVSEGNQVSLVTSSFPGAAAQESLDGVEVIRSGGPWTVYLHARRIYRERFRGKCDVVIDEVNTVPFFTPWYVQEPILMHFNQLAREVWFYECGFPLNAIGFLLEPWWLKIYRRTWAVAISRSSRQDLLRLGFNQHRVRIIPMPTKPFTQTFGNGREPEVTLLFVGRIKRSKRVDHTIRMLEYLKQRWPKTQLWIVGEGDSSYRTALLNLTKRLCLEGSVTFFGQVSEAQKQDLMSRAHALLVPSVREGWGIVVSEATSQRTPAIVYPVPGLVDSTEHQVTGLICERSRPRDLAAQVVELLDNQPLWRRLTQPSETSEPLTTWDQTARSYLDVIERCLGKDVQPTSFQGISLLIPACMWSGRSMTGIEEIARVCTKWGEACEIVLVERPGTERLQSILQQLEVPSHRIRVVSSDPFLGENYSLVTGSEGAGGEMVLYLDPNVDVPPGELGRLIESWRLHPVDILVASRRHGTSWRQKAWWMRWLSNAYHLLTYRLFGIRMGDVQTGIKLFRRSVLEKVLPRLVVKEYAFDLEVLAVAHRLGYSIGVQPIQIRPSTFLRRPHVLDMFHLLMDTLSIWYRLRWLRYYDRPLVAASTLSSVSIVIPCKGSNPYLKECLEACDRLDYPKEALEILVLPDDPWNCSNPKVKVIPTGKVGPGKKRDVALSQCRGEIVAFIDDDTVPRRDWLRHAVRWFEDERIAAVGGPAPTPASDSLRQSASGAVYSSWLVAGTQSYRYFPAPGRWVDDYPSCNLFIRKEILTQAGGFDTAFWPGEDTLLCSKITHELKKKIWYDPDVVVYHHRRPLFWGHLAQIRRYAEHRGYFAKRFPETSFRLHYFLPTILVLFFILGGLAAVLYPAWRMVYGVLASLYLLAALLWGILSLNLRKAALVFIGIIASHWTYGFFFLRGLFSKSLAEETRP